MLAPGPGGGPWVWLPRPLTGPQTDAVCVPCGRNPHPAPPSVARRAAAWQASPLGRERGEEGAARTLAQGRESRDLESGRRPYGNPPASGGRSHPAAPAGEDTGGTGKALAAQGPPGAGR